MSEHPSQTYINNQRRKGLHRYGCTLADANLTIDQILAHLVEELVDVCEYADAACALEDPGTVVRFARHVARHAVEHIAERLGPAPEWVPPVDPRALLLAAEADVHGELTRFTAVRDALAGVPDDVMQRLITGLAELVVAGREVPHD